MPNSPKKEEKEITDIPSGEGVGRFQKAQPGSYGIVSKPLPFPDDTAGVKVALFFQAWMPQCDHVQTLLSTVNTAQDKSSGFAVVI